MPFTANTTILNGRYTLITRLGAGGQAEVWRVRDQARGDELALKILYKELAQSPGAWEALEREHAIVSRLDHPLILKVFPPERDEEVLALPMELAPGGDLRRLRGVTYLEIGPILLELAEALAYAHSVGIVHRDLKPGNVLFDARGHVRLADFGIAGTALGSTSEASAASAPESTAAAATPSEPARSGLSPFTASPEQLRGEPPAISDDIYGLGALAYELLSGHPPYHPRFELKRAIEEPVPRLRPAHQTPERLIMLVMGMLAKQARQRPSSMQQVVEEIDASLNDTLSLADGDAANIILSASATGGRVPLAEPMASAVASDDLLTQAKVTVPSRVPGLPPVGPSRRTSLQPQRASSGAPELATAAARASAPVTRRMPTSAASRGAGAASMEAQIASARLPEPWRRAIETVSKRAPVAPNPMAATERAPKSETAAATATAQAVDAVVPPKPEQNLGAIWADVKVKRTPNLMRLEPMRRSRWPWVVVGLGAAAVAALLWAPRWTSGLADVLDQARSRASPNVVDAVKDIAQVPGHLLAGMENRSRPTSGSVADPLATPAATPQAATGGSRGATDSDSSSGPATSPVTGAQRPQAAAAAATPPSSDQARAARVDSQGRKPIGARGARDEATRFETRLAALEARGAAIWGGSDYADAKARAAKAASSDRAGSRKLAGREWNAAERSLDRVEREAPSTLATQLYVGERALQAGNRAAARQAFELAYRIDPSNPDAEQGLQRTRNLDGVLPLLSDGLDAEAARDYVRAAQDYGQALALDPSNAKAKAGLRRANAAMGADSYDIAVGAGFAALGAGRLDQARAAFTRALGINHRGREALAGLQRVNAALRSRGLAQLRSRAAELEAQERWGEALEDYDAALRLDPSLEFAREGRARATAQIDMTNRMQALVDDPQRLASPTVRAEAMRLIQRADEEASTGVLERSLAARLASELPGADKTVHLALISDNETEVQIPQIGSFGTFSRRDIDLKPGKYTVIGTRAGYRDVRRDVTIAPGEDARTISVRCEEPI